MRIMRLTILSICLFLSVFSFSQEESIQSSSKLYWSQKFGFNPVEEVTFTYKISGDTLFYTSRENTPKNLSANKIFLTKKTDRYLIGKAAFTDGYCFFDLKTKQLFVLDFYLNRYSVTSYGNNYSLLKQTLDSIAKKLSSGETQKDVMSFLISQTEHDF